MGHLRKAPSPCTDPDGGTLSPLIVARYLEQTARMSHWVDGMLENVDPTDDLKRGVQSYSYLAGSTLGVLFFYGLHN